MTRRAFVGAAAATLAASSAKPIRLGSPIFLKSDDPRELAREHRRLGYSAAYCPEAKVGDTARVREIEKAFAAENVTIAEVGAWVNMLDPDAAIRKFNETRKKKKKNGVLLVAVRRPSDRRRPWCPSGRLRQQAVGGEDRFAGSHNGLVDRLVGIITIFETGEPS